MKIMIVGVGKLGSQVAWQVLRELQPETLILSDIKDLTGDIIDLANARDGLGIETEITTEIEYSCDYVIICAGQGRDEEHKTMEDLLNGNIITMLQIFSTIPSGVFKNSNIIVMTNPVEKLTEKVKSYLRYSKVKSINNPEEELMKLRKKYWIYEDVGWQIVSTKGYSSFGPAIACINLIKKLEKIK